MLTVYTARAETAVPEKAERFLARGTAAIKAAETPEDFRAAAAEFRKAAEAAPSWPDPYYNAGVALEKAGDPAGARDAFQKYLKLAPNAPDAKQVRNRVYELEFLAEKQDKQKAQVADKKVARDRLVKSLEGAIYADPTDLNTPASGAYRIAGGKVHCGSYVPPNNSFGTKPGFYSRPNTVSSAIDENLQASNLCGDIGCPPSFTSFTSTNATISSDGETITWKHNCPSGRTVTYKRLK